MAILLTAGKIKSTQEKVGVGLGMGIGIVMSAILALLITIYDGIVRTSRGSTGYLTLFLPFLWIWLSAVFFPEYLSHRTNRRGLMVWIAVMLVFTAVIAIIVFSVFSGPGY